MRQEDLLDLMDRQFERAGSRENRINSSFWEERGPWNRDMWRGVPKRTDHGVPFTIAPDNSWWAKALGISLVDFYHDPARHMEFQLRLNNYRWDHFHDNTPLKNELFIWFSVVTELSLFGAPLEFFPQREPWLKGESVLADKETLDRMEFPDFHRSGLMPRIHAFYEQMGELAQGKMEVMFPEWVRGPVCLAMHLRGMENLLMDMLLDPPFVHRLMRFITDARKEWMLQRAKFLKQPIGPAKLYNDEIDGNILSPALYEQFVLPYEQEIADFSGGVLYWHSCGNTTAFISDIAKLKGLQLFHVGPWTAFQAAAEGLPPNVALDIDLEPIHNVLEATSEEMASHLEEIKRACGDRPFFVRADAFQPYKELAWEREQIARWSEIARKTLQRW
ncbi:methylcobalamin:coenzyme M methyltransferase [Peptococcaceae bacterium CEB3]|nr:methylcobalamin:coenzyme M methyltransferase [Peptococcaceae bacterium CEB3]